MRRLEIEFQPRSTPFAGRIFVDDGPGREFAGYIQLLAEVERARTSNADDLNGGGN